MDISVWSLAGICLILGYVIFHIMLAMLPQRLRKEHKQQYQRVVEKAQKRKQQILAEAHERGRQELLLYKEEMEEKLAVDEQEFKMREEELDSLEESVVQAETRIEKQERDHQVHRQKIEVLNQQFQRILDASNELRSKVQMELERISETSAERIKNDMVESAITERQLDRQRRIKEYVDDLSTHSRKFADRMLARALSRYEPEFFWPKAVNTIDLTEKKANMLLDPNNTILAQIRELAGEVEIELNTEETHAPIIRLGGGYGIFKEAARLTLEETLAKGYNHPTKIARAYAKHKETLERQAERLGYQAVQELQLHDIHPEIQKMVGALNWRTSYRQNQYFHSVEVAKLAGIVATELGVDPDMAKRCGLLHDIGKGIDYRIEGSHAVISADYADRYGERRIICDTVMSHHNDLVLETPLSFVLKTADTLSGARPGARVNLEEGYQIRLSAIEQVIRSFDGIEKFGIMSGGREVHVEVNCSRVKEHQIKDLSEKIAKKIEAEVAFPGQIKVLVTRKFEVTAVA
jgi:ribonuclease Y